MRKNITNLAALMMVFMFLLMMAACGVNDSPDATEPTGNTHIPTEMSGETVGETEPVQVTDPVETDATDPIVTAWDAAYFETLLNPQMYRGEHDWYNLALTSYYASPEEIDLYLLFYNGFLDQDEDPTPEELKFLEEQPGFESSYSLNRLPTSQMDAVMAKYFGTTLAACNQTGLLLLLAYGQWTGGEYSCHRLYGTGRRHLSNCLYKGIPGDPCCAGSKAAGRWVAVCFQPPHGVNG